KQSRLRQLADGGLPKSTAANLLNGKFVRAPRYDTVRAFVVACIHAASNDRLLHQFESVVRDARRWHAELERDLDRTAPGAVRVREARPQMLGVHEAIRAQYTETDQARGELPAYVPRDLDVGLRATITAVAARGGFVLLTGGAAAGKTRSLYEAVRAELPEWWLVHPTTTDEVRTLTQAPPRRTVLWLDELQNYLDQADGLLTVAVRRLVDTGVVVVATLRPEEYHRRTAPAGSMRPDVYVNDRRLLSLAYTVFVPDTFSHEERFRTEALAADDRRIRVALDVPHMGLTQAMAAGPQLVRRWEQAPADQCYGKAVITAALDARR
ncbi:hypothetical protein ACFQ1S_29835, partial [Kibdelosporangium lantanae]